MKETVPAESALAVFDARIKELKDWRGKMLAKVREIIHEADPEIVEEWKWRGTPVCGLGERPQRSAECAHHCATLLFEEAEAMTISSKDPS